jgi:hypothetical protein
MATIVAAVGALALWDGLLFLLGDEDALWARLTRQINGRRGGSDG